MSGGHGLIGTCRIVPPTASSRPRWLRRRHRRSTRRSRRSSSTRDGPLLVLAGPGTGKTTTLVEAVVARVAEGASPDEVLVLTFSRKAADELRERIATRVGRTVVEPAAHTFHGFCHARGPRRTAWPPGRQPPRLLSGAEREVRIRELLRGNAADEGLTRWPAELRPALDAARLRPRGRRPARPCARTRARRRRPRASSARSTAGPSGSRPARFLDEYLAVLEARGELDYAGLVAEATAPARRAGGRAVQPVLARSTSTSTRTPTRRRSGCCAAWPATAGCSSPSVTRTSRSTASAAPSSRTSPSSARASRAATARPAPVLSLQVCRRMGPELLERLARAGPAHPARRPHPRAQAASRPASPRAGRLGHPRDQVVSHRRRRGGRDR